VSTGAVSFIVVALGHQILRQEPDERQANVNNNEYTKQTVPRELNTKIQNPPALLTAHKTRKEEKKTLLFTKPTS